MIRTDSLAELRNCGCPRVALACGVFDGLHLGHQLILAELLKLAAATEAAPVALTFDPHPQAVLRADAAPALLVSCDHRLVMLARCGIRATVVLPFTESLAQLSPQDFVDDLLLASNLEITGICVGENWRFGCRAAGTTAVLAALGESRGFEVRSVPVVAAAGGRISSTRVRAAIAAGDLDQCEALLGRPFSVYGRVVTGRGVAAQDLHCPTANIASENGIFPPCGIYAAAARCFTGGAEASRTYPGVVYLGNAPTYVSQPPDRPFLEMHLFDYHGNLYGQHLEVEFLSFIRGDRKFAEPAELRRQIAADMTAARQVHASRDERAGR